MFKKLGFIFVFLIGFIACQESSGSKKVVVTPEGIIKDASADETVTVYFKRFEWDVNYLKSHVQELWWENMIDVSTDISLDKIVGINSYSYYTWREQLPVDPMGRTFYSDYKKSASLNGLSIRKDGFNEGSLSITGVPVLAYRWYGETDDATIDSPYCWLNNSVSICTDLTADGYARIDVYYIK